MSALALQLQKWAAEYDYELDIETASMFCTPQLQGATRQLIASKLDKVQKLNLPVEMPKLQPVPAQNVCSLYEREDARLSVKQGEEKLAIAKENIKVIQKHICAAKDTTYNPIQSKFMPKAKDLVVDMIPSKTLESIVASTTKSSRYLKDLRKSHVLSHVRANTNCAKLEKIKNGNPLCGHNLQKVRDFLQAKVNNLVQTRINLQYALENMQNIPDINDDVKEHIILLAQAQEQLQDMHLMFFTKVREAHLNVEKIESAIINRKLIQKTFEDIYQGHHDNFNKFDVLHSVHHFKKLNPDDWTWNNDYTIRQVKVILGIPPDMTFVDFCKFQTDHNDRQAVLEPLYDSLRLKFEELWNYDNSEDILSQKKRELICTQEYYFKELLPTLVKCIETLNQLELLKERVKRKVNARNWYFQNTERLVALFDRLEAAV